MHRLLMAGACLCMVATDAVSAAQCSSGLYLEIEGRVHAIERSSPGCMRALNSKSSIATICEKCRSAVNGILLLDSLLRKNQSCFHSPTDKKELRGLFAEREALRFLKRGCGF
jgi:hypothetical protein